MEEEDAIIRELDQIVIEVKKINTTLDNMRVKTKKRLDGLDAKTNERTDARLMGDWNDGHSQ